MKKMIIYSLLLLTALITGACSSGDATEGSATANETRESTKSQNEKSGSRTLVVYFSVPETNGTEALAGASRVVNDGEILGNTEQIAQWISEETGGDIFEITTTAEYPGDHDELVDQAAEELSSDTRPELASEIENLSDYDTIFIGFPIWWSDLPMPMYTFFDNTDFSGKTIIPFSTHGGSGFANTIETIVDLEPSATVKSDHGLTISRNNIASSRQEVIDWVSGLGYSK